MPYNILLVDDDREFRQEFCDLFDEYEITQADGGEGAIKALQRPNNIDLVVLDVMMPGKKGTDLLKEIKKKSPDVKIVMLTGHSSKELIIEALRGHADDYLEKPLNVGRARALFEKILVTGQGQGDLESQDSQGKVERIKRFLEKNWQKKVSLEDAAEIVCLSPKYLSRIFKLLSGQGFNEYKLQCKISKAKELLANSGYNISQIADCLGYQNIESFIRGFKQITGQTPTEYRQRRKNGKKRS